MGLYETERKDITKIQTRLRACQKFCGAQYYIADDPATVEDREIVVVLMQIIFFYSCFIIFIFIYFYLNDI
jgi:hypothetical protein